jgi:hypothetical protein
MDFNSAIIPPYNFCAPGFPSAIALFKELIRGMKDSLLLKIELSKGMVSCVMI